MFDGLKSLAAMSNLMRELPRIRQRMEEVKGRLGDMTTTAEAGGGAVRVTATGLLRVASIDVDASMLAALASSPDGADATLAGELIAAAVNAALERSREMAERELAEAAAELGIPMPSGGLAGLFG